MDLVNIFLCVKSNEKPLEDPTYLSVKALYLTHLNVNPLNLILGTIYISNLYFSSKGGGRRPPLLEYVYCLIPPLNTGEK